MHIHESMWLMTCKRVHRDNTDIITLPSPQTEDMQESGYEAADEYSITTDDSDSDSVESDREISSSARVQCFETGVTLEDLRTSPIPIPPDLSDDDYDTGLYDRSLTPVRRFLEMFEGRDEVGNYLES